MKKIYRFAVAILGIIPMITILPSIVYGEQNAPSGISSGNSIFDQDPVDALDAFYKQTNKSSIDRVQDTDLDQTSSSGPCKDGLGVNSNFTITRTLCVIKSNIGDYLQYLMYIGLSAATILLIWNGFKLVTSTERDKQISEFKKNFINIVIGVVLLVAFYYIIDVFVSVVNLVTE